MRVPWRSSEEAQSKQWGQGFASGNDLVSLLVCEVLLVLNVLSMRGGILVPWKRRAVLPFPLLFCLYTKLSTARVGKVI